MLWNERYHFRNDSKQIILGSKHFNRSSYQDHIDDFQCTNTLFSRFRNHLRLSTKILTTLPGIEEYIQKSNPDEYHIISFKDFAQYIADTELKDVDIHFRSTEQLCEPCRYPYTYITKTETSQKNLWWVLDKVGGEMPSFSKHIAVGGTEDTSLDMWEKERRAMTALFKELPLETVIKLKKLYQHDFTRFGYTFDLNTMTAGDVID